MGQIFNHQPEDWSRLQDLVAQLFVEMGCDTQVGTRVRLVRGEKEIDVLVRDATTTPPSTYLCECKFLGRPVSQEVVHSFRAVMADYGGHRGFVISRVGFQPGAREAARNTNVDLLTFDELQETFFQRWRIAMGKRFTSYADRLFPYWDYPGKAPRVQWSDADRNQRELLIAAYHPLIRLGPLFELEGSVWQLPMELPRLDDFGRPVGAILLNSYRDVYDFIDANKDIALRHFMSLYGELD